MGHVRALSARSVFGIRLPRFRIAPLLRVCQLVKVAVRDPVTRIRRRWRLARPASAASDPHVRGIALFPEPEDFTVSSPPCQGRLPDPGVSAPETRTSPT